MSTRKIESIEPDEIDALLIPAYGRHNMTLPALQFSH